MTDTITLNPSNATYSTISGNDGGFGALFGTTGTTGMTGTTGTTSINGTRATDAASGTSLVAQAGGAELPPNTLTVPGMRDFAVFVGKTAPMGFNFSGASGPPSVYVFGNSRTVWPPETDNFANPGVFIGIPLSQNGVNAAAFRSGLSFLLGPGPTTDALAGALLRQYGDIQNLINSSEFAQNLPAGARVIPQLVMTVPTHDVAEAVTGGIDEIDNAQLGIGLTIVLPGNSSSAGNGTAIFMNSRIAVSDAQDAIESGRPVPTARTFNFGVIALNVDVPRTDQTVNVGTGIGLAASSFEDNEPWQVRFPDGTTEPMPAPLAAVMNTLVGADTPIETDFDLSALAGRIGMTPEQIGQVVSAGETAFSLGSAATEVAGVVAAFKASPILGILMGAGLVVEGMNALDDAATRALAQNMVNAGRHRPEIALDAYRLDANSTGMAVYTGHMIGRAVDLAIETGVSTREEMHAAWSEAARAPWSPDDPQSAYRAIVANSVLGNYDTVASIARQIGDPIPDYSGDGPSAYMRGVASDALLGMRPSTGSLPDDQAVRVGQGFAGVPGIGQLEVRYDTRNGTYSAHGLDGAQYPLPGVTTRQEAIERTRELIENGAISPENMFPLQVTSTLPDTAATRVGQGFAGVPGVGQLEVRYDTRNGTYSAHGPDGAQYPLPGVTTRQEAIERTRELIENGAISPENMFPLQGTATMPDTAATRVGQGFAGVPGVGQLEVRVNLRDGSYSAHGPDGSQYPLPGVTTRREAIERTRELIENGAVSPDNMFPLTQTATIPQTEAIRIPQGYAGVPGVGQLEVRWDARTGDYSAHGPNGAQYPLPGVSTADEARARTRELIENGAVSPENMFPLSR